LFDVREVSTREPDTATAVPSQVTEAAAPRTSEPNVRRPGANSEDYTPADKAPSEESEFTKVFRSVGAEAVEDPKRKEHDLPWLQQQPAERSGSRAAGTPQVFDTDDSLFDDDDWHRAGNATQVLKHDTPASTGGASGNDPEEYTRIFTAPSQQGETPPAPGVPAPARAGLPRSYQVVIGALALAVLVLGAIVVFLVVT
jgi:hypothetical protein